jgi:hypothetical protein
VPPRAPGCPPAMRCRTFLPQGGTAASGMQANRSACRGATTNALGIQPGNSKAVLLWGSDCSAPEDFIAETREGCACSPEKAIASMIVNPYASALYHKSGIIDLRESLEKKTSREGCRAEPQPWTIFGSRNLQCRRQRVRVRRHGLNARHEDRREEETKNLKPVVSSCLCVILPRRKTRTGPWLGNQGPDAHLSR